MSTEQSTSVGKIIADSLALQGVEAAFCVPGESYLGVLDGLFDHADQIKVVTCRHEHGASNMAEAYGKLTGKVGLCMVTRGPGACNAAIGVHTAFQDSTPMVLLVGQVALRDMGREAFQEVDFEAMFAPLAKAVRQLERADDAAGIIHWAFAEATSGRPGPVVVALPEDLLGEVVSIDAAAPPTHEPSPRDLSGDMERLHRRLGEAHRPLMLVGGSGWTEQAKQDLQTFAKTFDLPVCTSFRRLDIFDNRHPCFVGEMGIAPNPALVERAKGSDLLLVVGARIGEMTSQGYTLLDPDQPQNALVHVHGNAAELGKVFAPALGIEATPEAFAHAASRLSPSVRWAGERSQARADYEAWRTPTDIPGPLQLGHVMRLLDEHLQPDAICTVDAGNYSGWPQRFLSFGGERRLLGPTSGAMGYAVPASVAAKVEHPDTQVVAFVGDGGFGMTGNELATACALDLNPIILVFNNQIYGTIRMHQECNFPGRVIATDLANPDYADLARAHGAFGETVETTDQFLPAFEAAVASNKAALIELKYDANIITTRFTLDDLKPKGSS